jgi:radical SAM protein with 4Fe4S-binding SPASM domain
MKQQATPFMNHLRSLEESFPSMVQVFTVDYLCNSRCRYCPVGRYNSGEAPPGTRIGGEAASPGTISLELFKRIAAETGRFPSTILRLHGRGEPLMHPNIVDMVRIAKEFGVGTISTFTNGILLDEEMAVNLMEAGLDLVEVSIDAYTAQTYSRIRRTDMFPAVVRNALAAVGLRDEMGYGTKILVSAVNHHEFSPERKSFEEYWGDRADQIIIRRRTTFNDRISYPDWEKKTGKSQLPCPQPWTRFNVSPSGKVLICSNDWGDEIIMGDLNDPLQTIHSIWTSEAYRQTRRTHLNGEDTPYCVNCTEDDGTRWSNSYEKIMANLDRNTNVPEISQTLSQNHR